MVSQAAQWIQTGDVNVDTFLPFAETIQGFVGVVTHFKFWLQMKTTTYQCDDVTKLNSDNNKYSPHFWQFQDTAKILLDLLDDNCFFAKKGEIQICFENNKLLARCCCKTMMSSRLNGFTLKYVTQQNLSGQIWSWLK